MSYSIETLGDDTIGQWEAFVRQSGEGTLFHSPRWKTILEEGLGLDLTYYLIRRNEEVVGACPFVERRTMHFRGLTSLPISEFNTIILDESLEDDDIDTIVSLFSTKYSFIQLTTCNPAILAKIGYDTSSVEESGTMILDLRENTPERIWNDILMARDRKNIRRFERENFTFHDVRRDEDIDLFYRYYLQHMRHIRGDVLPVTFFRTLFDSFTPDEMRMVMLMRDHEVAGGEIILSDPLQSTAYFMFLIVNRAFPNRYTPTLYLNWESIVWARDRGYDYLSFGTQKMDPNNPRFRNKARFGAEYVPVHSTLVLLTRTASMLYRLKKGLNERRSARAPAVA